MSKKAIIIIAKNLSESLEHFIACGSFQKLCSLCENFKIIKLSQKPVHAVIAKTKARHGAWKLSANKRCGNSLVDKM